MADKTIIMHISDLHFGIDKAPPEVWQYSREIYQKFLNGFSKMIKEEPSWIPDILVISGDIAWNGSEDNYKTANAFFEDFFSIEGNRITKENVILCFGNHDVDRKAFENSIYTCGEEKLENRNRGIIIYRPKPNINDLNDYHAIPLHIGHRHPHFQYIERFCQDMKFSPLSLSNADNSYKYAYGSRQNVNGIDFICLNTEWDCWGQWDYWEKNNDSSLLRIGLETYKEAINKLTGDPFMLGTRPRFVVYHRPLECLHSYEQFCEDANGSDRCVANLFYRQTDVSLTGHIHQTYGIYDGNNGAHTRISAGAVYAKNGIKKSKFSFSCNLISIPKTLKEGANVCEIRQFRYYPTPSDVQWGLVPFLDTFDIIRIKDYAEVSKCLRALEDYERNECDNAYPRVLFNNLSESGKQIVISTRGARRLNEIFKEELIKQRKKKFIAPLASFIEKNSNANSSGGNSIYSTKSDEKVKALELDMDGTSSGGIVSPDPKR